MYSHIKASLTEPGVVDRIIGGILEEEMKIELKGTLKEENKSIKVEGQTKRM